MMFELLKEEWEGIDEARMFFSNPIPYGVSSIRNKHIHMVSLIFHEDDGELVRFSCAVRLLWLTSFPMV